MRNTETSVIGFDKLTIQDLEKVGGKNASLGEMICHLQNTDVKVPMGFATTAEAYREFLAQKGMDKTIADWLKTCDVTDVKALQTVGEKIRALILSAPLTNTLENSIRQAYQALMDKAGNDISVAVRSSATAEDLPNASFAGQQETLLNVQGIDNVLHAVKQVFASLYNDRAIAYRVHQGFAHEQVALSVGIQHMVRSDLASSGVAFSVDTESGFDQVIFITSAYGLGETVVQGEVNPDEFYVYKPNLLKKKPAILQRILGSKLVKMVYQSAEGSVTKIDVPEKEQRLFSLTDDEIEQLAQQVLKIEEHYQRPMDVEWAKDGKTGELYIVQARPETVKSQLNSRVIERFQLKEKGTVLTSGRSVGQRIGAGKARIVKNIHHMHEVQTGDVLVTDMTDPDWEPVMKKASAIVTNRGGRTCHAAIIARELGIPAVVGCGQATRLIQEGQSITVSCAEGDVGYVYADELPYKIEKSDTNQLSTLPLKIMLNVGNPERAFAFQSIPNEGIGLARLEFIISHSIGIHPKALLQYDHLEDDLKSIIEEKIVNYASPIEYYIERLREGIATLAAAFYPKPVIVRLSDFKSNEYANLLGGQLFEPKEENPMLGYRGASRYIDPDFSACFSLECQAIQRVRNDMGLTNVQVMIPFVRTVSEAAQVIEALKQEGLVSGPELKIIMMCELPSNALLADQFLDYFDGFSIGSNDLTQLTLGLDRDSGLVANYFDERNEAVKQLLSMAIRACKKRGKYVGICGQGPSDHPDFAQWLVEQGIDSLSLNPDSVLSTHLFLAGAIVS